MQEEFVDIVTQADEVIGSCSKVEAHQKGLLHRTVIAEIIRPNGDWVLVQQASDRQDAGQFVSPVGGHVSSGESEDNALKREAFEECGLDGDVTFKLIGKKIFNREVNGKKENHYFILYEIYTDAELVINHESVGFETFSKAELKKQLQEDPKKFGDAFLFVVREFYRDLLSV
ncbi:MAG: isopentenyl-diphosphate Delta-isomerase [Patescibacteria group bacterium]|nr:MAG: isopentenyl-diphosphate Delta-isomerase [Patescibacteria group bacterium]